MKIRNLSAAIFAGALLLNAGCAKKEVLNLYFTSDAEGWIWSRKTEKEPDKETGGFAVLKKFLNSGKQSGIVVDGGDWFSQTPEGYLSKGKASIECMNLSGYGLSALGITDLKLDPQALQNLMESASFPVISSNIYLKNGKKPVHLQDYFIFETTAAKIGFLAVTIPDPAKPGLSKILNAYKIERADKEIQRVMTLLNKKRVKITALFVSAPAEKKLDHAFYEELLKSARENPDIILTNNLDTAGNHSSRRLMSHRLAVPEKPARIKNTWVIPAAPRLLTVERIDIHLNPAGETAKISHQTALLDKEKYGEAPDVMETIDKHRKTAAKYLDRRIGHAPEPLEKSLNGRSPAGEWICDCMRRWAKTNAAVLTHENLLSGLNKGDVTLRDVYNLADYDATLVFVKMRGQGLLNILNEHLKTGISVSGIEAVVENGGISRARINSRELAANRIYKAAVADSMIQKNPEMLSEALEFANSRRYLREIMAWCVSRNRTIEKPEGDRITEQIVNSKISD
ncbi:MAG: bifunctional metallophosphatase/5'-nucleotidase [Elusimicrobia bacterium]|nr:bifunctional metallophosphatase/5'-nucleotidase [Elusimicrobiota bacterium]